MPAFTSTTLTTLFRKAVSVARYVHLQPTTSAGVAMRSTVARQASAPPRRSLNTLHRTRQAVQQVLRQTFPSVGVPSHQLHESIHVAARGLTSSSHAASGVGKASRRLTSQGQGAVGRAVRFASAGGRPRSVSGPSIQANVGLGSARTFASASAFGPASGVQAKVPMTLRAFASLLNDDDERDHALPRASRYAPYARKNHEQQQRNLRLRSTRTRTCSTSFGSRSRGNIGESYRHYFHLPLRSSPTAESDISLPPTPETLITEGTTTILALPLSPSFDALLEPTPLMSYADSSIGVSILSRLTQGILPIHQAFSTHSSTRISPLLHKLDSLGVLDPHPWTLARTRMDVVRDCHGQPDMLRIVFHDRSLGDIKALLGGSLRAGEEGEWWALYETAEQMELSVDEQQSLMEDWAAPPTTSDATLQPAVDLLEQEAESVVDTEQLVFPTLDMTTNPLPLDDNDDAELDALSCLDIASPSSWPTSGSLTPFSPGISTVTSPTPRTYANVSLSFIASLNSSLSQLSDGGSDGEVIWEITPSEADSDVESAYDGESESWGDGSTTSQSWDAVLVLRQEESEERPGSPSILGRWSGSGQGFGFTQPW